MLHSINSVNSSISITFFTDMFLVHSVIRNLNDILHRSLSLYIHYIDWAFHIFIGREHGCCFVRMLRLQNPPAARKSQLCQSFLLTSAKPFPSFVIRKLFLMYWYNIKNACCRWNLWFKIRHKLKASISLLLKMTDEGGSRRRSSQWKHAQRNLVPTPLTKLAQSTFSYLLNTCS